MTWICYCPTTNLPCRVRGLLITNGLISGKKEDLERADTGTSTRQYRDLGHGHKNKSRQIPYKKSAGFGRRQVSHSHSQPFAFPALLRVTSSAHRKMTSRQCDLIFWLKSNPILVTLTQWNAGEKIKKVTSFKKNLFLRTTREDSDPAFSSFSMDLATLSSAYVDETTRTETWNDERKRGTVFIKWSYRYSSI